MKYDGSAGVRARYSSIRLRYVRWTAITFVGSAGARYVAVASSSARAVVEHDRVALAATPARLAVDEDADAASQRWAAYSSSSHTVTASRSSSPTASPKRSTSKRFIATNVATSSGAEPAGQPLVRLERVERRTEVRREPRPRVRVVHPVGVAHHRLGRLEPALDPVEPRDAATRR